MATPPQDSYNASATTADPNTTLTLANDPAYLAFLRTSGLANQTALAAYKQRAQQYAAAVQPQVEGMQRDAAQQQENLAGSAESRGMLASGQYLKDSANLADRQARAQWGLQNDASQRIADLGYQLALGVSGQQQNAANAGLDAASRVAQQNYALQNPKP